MRCFVALDLPRPVRNHLAKVTAPLRERFDLKWVEPEHMHVTLLFAPELADAALDELRDDVDELDVPSIELSLSGFGVFPPKGLPRIAWAGLAGDLDTVARLHGDLQQIGEHLDVPRERRPLTPHVTVARLRSQFGALALIDRLQELGAELNDKPFHATAVTIYESRLTPRGPRYDVLYERRL